MGKEHRTCVRKAFSASITRGCAPGHEMGQCSTSVGQKHGTGNQLSGNRAGPTGAGKSSLQSKGCLLAGRRSLPARLRMQGSGQGQDVTSSWSMRLGSMVTDLQAGATCEHPPVRAWLTRCPPAPEAQSLAPAACVVRHRLPPLIKRL